MLKLDPQFKRVRAGGASWDGRTSYWLGPDHLLAVTVGRFAEGYRRFFYADIEAVVVRRTQVGAWTLGIAGAVVALGGLGAGASAAQLMNQGWNEQTVAVLVLTGVFAVAALVIGAYELIQGPTCECRIHTAVQVRELPGIKRWRNANRLLAALDARVRQAQALETDEPQARVPQEGIGGEAEVEAGGTPPAAVS